MLEYIELILIFLTGQPLDGLASLQVNPTDPGDSDIDAINHEEQEALTEDMADYLQSIVD